jgi:hypothetical protein
MKGGRIISTTFSDANNETIQKISVKATNTNGNKTITVTEVTNAEQPDFNCVVDGVDGSNIKTTFTDFATAYQTLNDGQSIGICFKGVIAKSADGKRTIVKDPNTQKPLIDFDRPNLNENRILLKDSSSNIINTGDGEWTIE